MPVRAIFLTVIQNRGLDCAVSMEFIKKFNAYGDGLGRISMKISISFNRLAQSEFNFSHHFSIYVTFQLKSTILFVFLLMSLYNKLKFIVL